MEHDFERGVCDLGAIVSDKIPLNMHVHVDDDYVSSYGLFDELSNPPRYHFDKEGVCSNIMEEKKECGLLKKSYMMVDHVPLMFDLEISKEKKVSMVDGNACDEDKEDLDEGLDLDLISKDIMQNGASEGCFDVLEMMKMDAYNGAYLKHAFSCNASLLREMNCFDWNCYEHESQAILWSLFYDEVYGRYLGS